MEFILPAILTGDLENEQDEIEYGEDNPVYCLCNEPEYGKMVKCSNDECPREWFHYKCVNLKKKPKKTRKDWFCSECS